MQSAIAPGEVVTHAGSRPSARRPASPDRCALVVLLAIPVLVTLAGLSYYAAPVAERMRSPLHAILRPSGVIGQSFGIAGLLLFLSMWLYPLRKSLRWLSRTGSVGAWMRVHTVIGLSLPALVAVHAGWKFHGLIGLGYAAMLLVCLSGFVGRYLYTRIPRSRNGLELSLDEVSGERRSLLTEIAAALELDPMEVERSLATVLARPAGDRGWNVLQRLVADDFARWRSLVALRKAWSAPRAGGERVDARTIGRALRLARREIALDQQIRLLSGTQRLLRYWHVAHRPVAITALFAVLVHVGVAIAMGQTWLR